MMSHLLRKYHLNSIICIVIYLFVHRVDVHGLKLQYNGKSVEELHSRERAVNLAKTKFVCPLPFGTFSDPEDCSAFQVCAFGIAHRQKCPRAMHFDIFRRTCLPILIAVCDKGKENKRTTSAEKITTLKEGKFTCPSFFGSYPHPADCSKYYTCSFFVATLKSCPENQLFDVVKKVCKPEKEVNCGSRQRPTSETTTITTPMPQKTTSESTVSEKPTTTEEVTTAEMSTAEEQITPLMSTFKPTGPPETDCDEDDLDCIITETGEIPDWFECPVDVGAYPHPSNKKLFIFCQNWKPFVKKCGQDLIFSREKGTCVSPTR